MNTYTQINTETIYFYKEILKAARELMSNSQYNPYKIHLGNENFFVIEFENLLNNEIVPFFVNKKEVAEIVSKRRKKRVSDIFVHPLPKNGVYIARNTLKQTTYQLTPYHTHIECDCKDYEAQSYYFQEYKKFACKHILAMIRELDYSHLEEYLSDDWNTEKAYQICLNKIN